MANLVQKYYTFLLVLSRVCASAWNKTLHLSLFQHARQALHQSLLDTCVSCGSFLDLSGWKCFSTCTEQNWTPVRHHVYREVGWGVHSFLRYGKLCNTSKHVQPRFQMADSSLWPSDDHALLHWELLGGLASATCTWKTLNRSDEEGKDVSS